MKPARWSFNAAGTLLLGGASVACAALSGLGSYTTTCTDDCDATAGGPTPGDDGSNVMPMEAAPSEPDASEDSGHAGDDTEDSGDAAESPDVVTTMDADGALEGGPPTEGGTSAEAGPLHDAGGTADASDGACTSTNTVANCGACGASCDTTTGTPACNGGSCRYTCDSNRIDCNAGVAPDTDGCECAGTACCGTVCETAHETGIPAPTAYYTCTPTGNSNLVQATAVCLGVGGLGCAAQTAECPTPTSGLMQTLAVCGTVSNTCYCWIYSGVNAGTVGVVALGCSAIQCTAGNPWN